MFSKLDFGVYIKRYDLIMFLSNGNTTPYTNF